MAAALLGLMLADPPLSLASQLPPWIFSTLSTVCILRWQLSSPGEAAMAAALLGLMLADPPLSQASQLPHWILSTLSTVCILRW